MSAAAEDIIGRDTSLKQVFRILSRVAPTDSTVLVTGESGTGKELVVRALHRASRRSAGPFVPVNCGAIPRDLLESELFGHEKGAFTGALHARRGRFELASGGTIFLDEIGEMDPLLQVKILRVLQEHEIERVGGNGPLKVDVRIVAATNRVLEEEVEAGRFREDLFYRLNVIPLHLPPLRERGEDILTLATAFLRRFCAGQGRPLLTLSPLVRRVFMAYAWPGNVRELENFMERLSILTEGDVIEVDNLPGKLRKALADMGGPEALLPAGSAAGDAGAQLGSEADPAGAAAPAARKGGFAWPTLHDLDELGLDLRGLLEAVEDRLMDEALAESGGVRNRAADRLGIKRTTFVEKLNRRAARARKA